MEKTVKIKEGDIIEFLAISWNESHWEFDYPTVLLKPVIQYSPNGDDPDMMIDDAAIDLAVNGELEDNTEGFKEEADWRGWKLSIIKRVAKDLLAGKEVWKTKLREVVYKKIQFIKNSDGELEEQILDIKTVSN